ncbi:hypothetical protein tb265_12710 [Gemmatimonadetes bacterium T265]|nr:hypothetical protein tb265_12710 [Gemmatimonadetes bacterium T265]
MTASVPADLETTPDARTATARAAPAAPTNIPAALSSFVGRAREVASVRAALEGARLLTLTGPGGAGKTRLAREVAAALAAAASYADGVWWVELAPVAAGDDVAPAVASVLGVRLESAGGAAAVLAAAVGPRHLLLVLDNCEHVVAAAAALADALLRTCPQLTVLATSREALAVEGEAAWVVPPLAHPPRARQADPFDADPRGAPSGRTAADVGGYDAVQLFVERARGVQAAFALADRNADAVAAVCARLDGVPLALELAAAHVGALGVEQLAERLDDVLGLLTRGRRTAAPRHQTLRAVLDWSYALLAPAEQALLCRMSVFRDAATLDAVAAVCGAGGGGNDAATVAALGRLVEQSLVQVRDVADASGGEVRYALLETVRQYGAERLAGTAEEVALRDRHLAWAADYLTRAEERFWSARWVDESARLTPVLDDLRAAVQWAAAAVASRAGGTPSPDDAGRAEAALRVAGGLLWHWMAAGNFGVAIPLTETALRTAVVAGLAAGAPPIWAPAPGASPGARRALAGAVTAVAGLYVIGNRVSDGVAAAERSVALWEAEARRAEAEGGDHSAWRWLVYARIPLAEGHSAAGDMRVPLALSAANVLEGRALGSREVWFALARHGRLLYAAGDHAAARLALDEAIASLAAGGEFTMLANTEQTRAEVGLATGDLADAAAHLRAAIAAQRDELTSWVFVRSLDLAAQLALAGALPGAPVDAAVRLLGAAAGIRRRAGIDVIYYDRPAYDRTTSRARERCAEPAFRAAWDAGECLAVRAAYEYAVALPWPTAPAGAAPPGDGARAADALVGAARGTSAGPSTLGLRVLGPLALAANGVPTTEPLPLGKVAELLLWLVLHPAGTKEQIGLDLWPDASAAQLRSNFHFTLHHLRRTLGDRRWVAHEQGHYRLARALEAGGGGSAARLACDADALFATADLLRAAARTRAPLDAAGLDGAALGEARRVLAASAGELGAGLALGDWVVPHQDRARAAWEDGMAVVAHALAAAGRHAEALAAYEAVLARDPLREAAHRAVMAVHAAAGEPARALAHYDALAALLAREVGARPSRETQALAERLRAA